MKPCPFCKEQIQDEAIKCRFCGERLDTPPGQPPAAPGAPAPAGAVPVLAAVRAGTTQAKVNEQSANVFFGQIGVIAIAVGVWQQSWVVFGVTLVGLLGLASVKPLASLLAILLGVGWGAVGVAIGKFFDSAGAMVVLGALLGLAGIGMNLQGAQFVRDLSKG